MIKNKLKKFVILLQDYGKYFQRSYMRYLEKLKFQDPRRVSIYSKVHLTSEQEKQIDNFFIKNYGKKVPHIWHRHYTAFTGKFDINYFPELLYIPEFEIFMNYNRRYATAFSDKNILATLAQTVGVKVPHFYVSCAAGCFVDSNYNYISRSEAEHILNNIGEAFIKPTTSSQSGQGCAVINITNGIDTTSGLSVSKIIDNLGDNFVVQERLKCHESISKIYPHSVNTFRIITYRWKDEICHTPFILRIGANGKNLDNAHAGGIFIAVNDDGTLHKTAFTEFKKQYTKHPNTGFCFEGHVIKGVQEMINAAKRMHASIPQLGIYNWDFTIDENGAPVLIEANVMGGGMWIIQFAHGKGLFGERTAEILRWMRKMKSIPYSKWHLYGFGR